MRNQGTRVSLDYGRSSRTSRQVNAKKLHCVFPVFKEITVKERDFARISEHVEATIWRIRETIRVGELVATHRLGQMRRLLMHEKCKTWKRVFGFDRIETATEMDEKRSRTSTSPVPDPSFYRNMVIPRHPHTPDEFTLEIKVDVEGLRMEIILSQPASSQCFPSPRRPAVNTGSEEPGEPRRSPAIGKELGPGVSQFETSTEEERFFPLETSIDGFLNSNLTSTEEEYVLLQPDIGMDDNNETTTQQAAARGARPMKKRQQQGMAAWLTDQNRQFDRGRSRVNSLLFWKRKMFACRVYCIVCFPLCFV